MNTVWSESEKKRLQEILQADASDFPDNYQNAADKLNYEFGNNRTSQSCKWQDTKTNKKPKQ